MSVIHYQRRPNADIESTEFMVWLDRIVQRLNLEYQAPVTETAATHTLGVDTGSLIADRAGTVTVTLPSALTFTGREVWIKTVQNQTVVSAASDVVPLVGGAAGTAILAGTAGKWALLKSDGTNWVIIAGN